MPLLLLAARVVLASAVFFPVLFVEGDMECGWFLQVAGASVVPASSGLQFVLRLGEIGFLQVAVWRMGAFERRLLASVVDVSVIMQLKFQQSFVEFYKVPQLQYIDRVVVISVASQRQGSQCKLCYTGDSTVQFCAKVLTCPCCAFRDSAENCGLPAVAGIDMVVDVPVVQFVLVGLSSSWTRSLTCRLGM